MGHIATICFHRYDKLDTNPSNNTGTNFVLQTSLTNESPFALMAFHESLQDPSWYLDSGASNHVTTELGNLSLKGKEVQGSLPGRPREYGMYHLMGVNEVSVLMNKEVEDRVYIAVVVAPTMKISNKNGSEDLISFVIHICLFVLLMFNTKDWVIHLLE